MFVMTKEPKTKEAAQEAVTWLFDNFTYTSEAKENWSIDYSGLKNGKGLQDDCDGWTHGIMGLWFSMCGFNLSDLALCITDVNPNDEAIYDHIVAGVYIDGDWLYSQNWTDKLLTQDEIVNGGYEVEGGNAVGMKLVQYRILNTSKDQWFRGKPNHV